QIAAGGHLLAIDTDDDVASEDDGVVAEVDATCAGHDTGLLRARADLLDEQALLVRREAYLLLGLRAQIGQGNARDTYQRMSITAILDQLAGDAPDDVDRDREANTLVSA